VQALLDQAKRVDATDLRKAARRLVELVDPEGEERRDEAAMEREERACIELFEGPDAPAALQAFAQRR
jgi:hypothetical protein